MRKKYISWSCLEAVILQIIMILSGPGVGCYDVAVYGGYPTDCLFTSNGWEYAGTQNITWSGRTCRSWNEEDLQKYDMVKAINFPEGSLNDAKNYCRNPAASYFPGAWCFTTDPDLILDNCDIPPCGCKVTEVGSEYQGQINITQSGKNCQGWDSQNPHSHSFVTSVQFPDEHKSNALNYCRNPESSKPNGPWCYTTDRNVVWEYCNIPFCDMELVTFTSPATSTGAPMLTSTINSSIITTLKQLLTTALKTTPPTTFPASITATTAIPPRPTTVKNVTKSQVTLSRFSTDQMNSTISEHFKFTSDPETTTGSPSRISTELETEYISTNHSPNMSRSDELAITITASYEEHLNESGEHSNGTGVVGEKPVSIICMNSTTLIIILVVVLIIISAIIILVVVIIVSYARRPKKYSPMEEERMRMYNNPAFSGRESTT